MAQLAAVLRQKPGSIDRPSLVPIQPSGSRPPLFCVHPAGGTVLCYLDLARRLGTDQPIYGLEARGLDGTCTPSAQISEMATRYIDALRVVQPSGPYHLGGWCVGGTIAFEMASQLRQMGEVVKFLFLIDSYAPAPNEDEDSAENDDIIPTDNAIRLAMFVKGLGGHFGKEVIITPDELRQLTAEEQRLAVLARLQAEGMMPPDAGIEQLENYLNVYMSNGRALNTYSPQAYLGQMTLFRAMHEPLHQYFDDTLGWGRFTADPITIYDVPGNHSTMIFEPNVQVLAEKLEACLLSES